MKVKNKDFPHDKKVIQLSINGDTKKVNESYMLIKFHGWTALEVRAMQASRNN